MLEEETRDSIFVFFQSGSEDTACVSAGVASCLFQASKHLLKLGGVPCFQYLPELLNRLQGRRPTLRLRRLLPPRVVRVRRQRLHLAHEPRDVLAPGIGSALREGPLGVARRPEAELPVALVELHRRDHLQGPRLAQVVARVLQQALRPPGGRHRRILLPGGLPGLRQREQREGLAPWVPGLFGDGQRLPRHLQRRDAVTSCEAGLDG
mmetsp:Transcript_20593/g.52548  ORF Transcript_20593/g.52548 Transcript_20593/m.52548 type:complete len:208 (+) Transcript_20593:1304-1927(+)